MSGMKSFGKGLYLKTGKHQNSWIFRFQMNKKTHDLGLGPADLVEEKDCREKIEKIRKLLLDGVNPLDQKRGKEFLWRSGLVKNLKGVYDAE